MIEDMLKISPSHLLYLIVEYRKKIFYYRKLWHQSDRTGGVVYHVKSWTHLNSLSKISAVRWALAR